VGCTDGSGAEEPVICIRFVFSDGLGTLQARVLPGTDRLVRPIYWGVRESASACWPTGWQSDEGGDMKRGKWLVAAGVAAVIGFAGVVYHVSGSDRYRLDSDNDGLGCE
jgi:hypothetical protein